MGYSRAVRAGDRVEVSGTGPIWSDGSCPDDAAVQARRCFEIIADALAAVGAGLADVIRTRMFITDPAVADSVGTAHGELFGDIRPAATMVIVAGLLDPRGGSRSRPKLWCGADQPASRLPPSAPLASPSQPLLRRCLELELPRGGQVPRTAARHSVSTPANYRWTGQASLTLSIGLPSTPARGHPRQDSGQRHHHGGQGRLQARREPCLQPGPRPQPGQHDHHHQL
ncbi:MAG: Rid family hydrolase [Pseudonocardia sp.]